jgi:predicted nucleic acid-binding protein
LLATHRLTTGLSIPDCLVAAMALTRSTRLFTFNAKHYQVVPSLEVAEPFSRS